MEVRSDSDAERETLDVSRVGQGSTLLHCRGALPGRRVSISFGRCRRAKGMWHSSECVIAFRRMQWTGLRNSARLSSVLRMLA